MSLIRRALEASLNEHDLVGLHTDASNLDKFSLGWITVLSATGYCLNSVDEHGGPDVIQVGQLSDILRVARRGPYIDGMQSIIASNLAFTNRYPSFETADLLEALQEIAQRKRVVTVATVDGTETTGLLGDVEAEEFEIRTYNRVGEYKGDEIIRLEDVFRIEFSGRGHLVLESILQIPRP